MDLQNQRIVIVDDDPNFAALLRYELSMNGYLRVEYFQDPDAFYRHWRILPLWCCSTINSTTVPVLS